MKIVADENIVAVADLYRGHGELQLMPGRAISREQVRDADVLLVRSITRVDRALLEGSRVRFVATATSGTDHLDLPWLAQQGIAGEDGVPERRPDDTFLQYLRALREPLPYLPAADEVLADAAPREQLEDVAEVLNDARERLRGALLLRPGEEDRGPLPSRRAP